MKKINIAWIPGDGIGPDVVNEGVKVLKAIEQLDKNISFSFPSFPRECEYYFEQKMGALILETMKEIWHDTDKLTPDSQGTTSTSELGDYSIQVFKNKYVK